MISVAMATYNGEAFIEKQLSSILKQNVSVDEIIICDDCSKDNTISIIKNVIKKTNTLINFRIIINKKNIGYINNFYNAISLTKGDYIFLADQDDIWEVDKVKKCIEIMNENKYDAVCSKFKLIDTNGNAIPDTGNLHINTLLKKDYQSIVEISLLRLAFGNISPGCTYCFSKGVKNIYLELRNEEVIHDYQIMLIAASCGKVALYPEPLIRYRLHENNSVGFKKRERKISIGFHKIRKKPFMAEFFSQLNKICKVKFCLLYELLYYLRIPHIKSKLRKLLFG